MGTILLITEEGSCRCGGAEPYRSRARHYSCRISCRVLRSGNSSGCRHSGWVRTCGQTCGEGHAARYSHFQIPAAVGVEPRVEGVVHIEVLYPAEPNPIAGVLALDAISALARSPPRAIETDDPGITSKRSSPDRCGGRGQRRAQSKANRVDSAAALLDAAWEGSCWHDLHEVVR
jgi:hypothetical protein